MHALYTFFQQRLDLGRSGLVLRLAGVKTSLFLRAWGQLLGDELRVSLQGAGEGSVLYIVDSRASHSQLSAARVYAQTLL